MNIHHIQPEYSTILFMVICHFLADFTHLSTRWMLSAKAIGSPLFPILCHAAIHGALIGIVSCNPICAVVVLVSHFLIDMMKGKLNVWFPSLKSPSNIWHWYIFGLDQMLHILIILTLPYYAHLAF